MTYVIEGELRIKEKPEMFLDKFVEFEREKIIINHGNVTETKSKRNYLYTNSEKLAKKMNNRGHNFKFIDDRAVAEEMCEITDIAISKSKLFAPKSGWPIYLTQNFGNIEEYETLSGELQLWKETRFPLPFLYTAAVGHLENVFAYEKNLGFTKKTGEIHDNRLHKMTYSGKKFVWGVALDTSIVSYYKLNTNISEKRIIY